MDMNMIKQSAEVRDKVKLFLSRKDTASDSPVIKELEMLKFTNPVLAAFIKRAIERALVKLRKMKIDTQDRGDETKLLKIKTEERNKRENGNGESSPLDVHFVQLTTYINEKRSEENLRDEIKEIEKLTIEKKERKQTKIEKKLLKKQAEKEEKEKKKSEKKEKKRIKEENKKLEKRKRKQHKEQKRVEKEVQKKAKAEKTEIEKQSKKKQKEEKKAEKERKKLAKSERERIRLILAENGFNLVDDEDDEEDEKNVKSIGRYFTEIFRSFFSRQFMKYRV